MKYVCTVCGFIYDEEIEGVPFSELPEDWSCPLCGAPKSLFEAEKKEVLPEIDSKVNEEVNLDMVKLSAGELSILFSNLARGCEKQYQEEAMNCFNEISSYFRKLESKRSDLDLDGIAKRLKKELDEEYLLLRAKAVEAEDRGTLRVVTWGEKVTKIAKSLIDRYMKDGDNFLNDTNLYVCTVCGFLYLGNKAPELCPVCKVPSWKFENIKGDN